MTDLILYTRRGCGLCDRLRALIEQILEDEDRTDLRIVDRDIESDPDLRDRFGERIPVVTHGGQVLLEGRPDAPRIREALSAIDEE